MRNITGSPVEGDDFFGRKAEIIRFLRHLDDDAHLLLTAPRRVGKTSLVLELCRRWRQRDQPATFFNVEDCAYELAFVERLVGSLTGADLRPDLAKRLAAKLKTIRSALGSGKLAAAGLEVEIAEDAESGVDTVASVVESILRRVEEGDRTVLVAVDELPEMLHHLLDQPNGSGRVSRFLHWLRQLRQTYRRRVRWMFLGSIGLDGFTERHHLGKTVNDLKVEHLGVFTDDEAHEFLQRLAVDHDITFDESVRHAVLTRVGWALPHHLQLVFNELRSVHDDRASSGGMARALDAQDVDTAFERLVCRKNDAYFDTWRQRLKAQLDTSDAAAARRLLDAVAHAAEGLTRGRLLDVLMSAFPSADVDVEDERLSSLLTLLHRDGYLMHVDGERHAFRSFLLREYWHRRNLR